LSNKSIMSLASVASFVVKNHSNSSSSLCKSPSYIRGNYYLKVGDCRIQLLICSLVLFYVPHIEIQN
jgi:hypothetical protein